MTLAKCFIAIVAGFAVMAVLSVATGALVDTFVLTRDQLIDNDPRVLSAHVITKLVIGIGGFIVAAALGAFAATWVAARWVAQSAVPYVTVSGVILLIAVLQVVLIGHNLWVCLVLAAVWLACVYSGRRLQARGKGPR